MPGARHQSARTSQRQTQWEAFAPSATQPWSAINVHRKFWLATSGVPLAIERALPKRNMVAGTRFMSRTGVSTAQ